MDLTPLDVRKKRDDLRRAVRGYDPAQVDAFLDLVADRMDGLVREQVRLNEQLSGVREQLKGFQERERALNEALIAAQELREEARLQAESTANLRIREAGQEADRMLGEARRAVEDSERKLRELQGRRASFLRDVRASLERFLREIDLEEERLSASDAGVEESSDGDPSA